MAVFTSNKKVSRRKQSRWSRLASALKPGSAKKNFVLFIVAFAIIGGGYMAYRSFAFTLDLSGAEGEFTAVNPARILDTRDGTGGINRPIGPGQTMTAQITGRGGIPASNVKAVVLNVTVTGPTANSHLALWPNGQTNPGTSNLNFSAGQTIPNQVVVKVGTGGKIQIFNNSGSVHVIIDVAGYFSDVNGNRGSRYASLTPARILDTRDGVGGYTRPLGNAQTYEVQVAGQGGVPLNNVRAVVMNVTVTGPTDHSHLSVYPTGTPQPLVSNLNFGPGQTIPNQVTVKVGDNGKVNVFNNKGNVNVIFDIAGYYADIPSANANSQEGRFNALDNPVRIIDTRTVSTGPVRQTAYPVQVAGARSGLIPRDAVGAIAANATVTGPTASSYLTVWPGQEQRPATSSLNYTAGQTIPNMVTAKVGEDGKVQLYNAYGSAQVILDVAGYYIDYERGQESISTLQTSHFSEAQKVEYDLRLNSLPTTVGETRINIEQGSDSANIYLQKNGQAEIRYHCYPMLASDCKLLAPNGRTGDDPISPGYTLITIPQTFQINRPYTFTTEVKNNVPGYPGKWQFMSITPPGGAKVDLAAVKENLLQGQRSGPGPYVSVNGQVQEFKCEKSSLFSWNIENAKIDGQSFTLGNYYSAIFNYNTQNTNVPCKGYSRVDMASGSSNQTIATYKIGIPTAERDTTPPNITGLTKEQYGDVLMTATDNGGGIVYSELSATPNQSTNTPPYWATRGVPSPFGPNYSTRFWFGNLPAGSYTMTASAMDNSGNYIQKTFQVNWP